MNNLLQVKQVVNSKVKKTVRKESVSSMLAVSPDIVIRKKTTKTPAKPTRKGQKSMVRILCLLLELL